MNLLLLVASPAFAPALAAAPPDLGGGDGKPLLTKEEALKLAFGKAKVERVASYLDKAQAKRAAKLAGSKLASAAVRGYRASLDGKWVGTAYFDTHKVRTKGQTVMVVVGRDGRVARIELLQFAEPPEYIPSPKWYAQFKGKKLDDKLAIKSSIRGFTGASLTARATTSAVRRVLAAHQVVIEIEAAKKKKKKKQDQQTTRGGSDKPAAKDPPKSVPPAMKDAADGIR